MSKFAPFCPLVDLLFFWACEVIASSCLPPPLPPQRKGCAFARWIKRSPVPPKLGGKL